MKIHSLPLWAVLFLLFSSIFVHASVFDEPEDQIYLENLNNIARLRASVCGGNHGSGKRNPMDDLKFLEMTARELQKRHGDIKEITELTNNVKKNTLPAIRTLKINELAVIHDPCEKNKCKFLDYMTGKDTKSYDINNIIKKLVDLSEKKDERKKRKIESGAMDKLRNYAQKLKTFNDSCDALEKLIKELLKQQNNTVNP